MRFVEIINKKKFTLISIILFSYVILNLLDGERGLISYFQKQIVIEKIYNEKQSLLLELKLLTDIVDEDYLEILYREKFLVGKSNERIYIK